MDLCNICLQPLLTLTTLSETDATGLKLCAKLAICVPEVEWSSDEKVCNVCVKQVDSLFAFRKQCILSHSRQTVEANSDSESIIEVKQEQKRATRINCFQCDYCLEQFNRSKSLVAHALAAHNVTMKPFRCDKCGNRFGKSSNLIQHKKYHEGNRENVCAFCGKTFIMKGDLVTHEKKHLNKREYTCELCPKQFNTLKDLRSHKLIVHSDPKNWNFSCTICNKKFPIKSNYDQHMRRHNGDKRFSCHLCDKKFVDKVVLKRHIVSHSNVCAHKCEHCQKEYKERYRLEVHRKKAHGLGDVKVPERVKKFFCHICSKGYFVKNKLTKHLCSHSGEKPFSCNVCNKKFVDKYYVKQHLKNAHNVLDS